MKHRSRSLRGSKKKTIGVIGLGYVGLPLACLAAEKGYHVIGVARNTEKIAQINAGRSPIRDSSLQRWLKRVTIDATTDIRRLKACSTVVICVPTPVDELFNPDLTPVRDAAEMIAKHGRKGVLVVLESTVNPGVSEEIVLPILSRGGKREGRDFFLAHCPERIDPGSRIWSVRNIPRVVGSLSARGLTLAVRFYTSILEAPVKPMRSIKEAEAVKIMENSFRDVNIAFINEMAKSFEKLGIDVVDVIEGAKTKPFAFLAHYPSCGVGGHCIPVDPYYLIERAKQSGFDHKFLKLAREINNSMPEYTVNLLMHGLNSIGRPVKGTRVGVLGLAYKANIEDTRESPSYEIIHRLKELGAEVVVFDPFVAEGSTVKTLAEVLGKTDALVLATNHRQFLELEPRQLKRSGIRVVVDGKNAWSKEAFLKAGLVYQGIGR